MNQNRSREQIPLPTFAILFLFALVFHALAAFSSRGSGQAEEQFRIMELARSKSVTLAQPDLAAELQARSRPMLQPALAFLLAEGARQCGITNRQAQIILAGILSAGLGITLSLLLFVTYRDRCASASARTWLFSLLLLLWFLVSVHSSFSPESWCGMFFFFGVVGYLRRQSGGDAINILIGLPLGISLFFRFEALFMVVGFVAWLALMEHEELSMIGSLLLGVACGMLLGVLADRNIYGEWTFTPWNYLRAQLSGPVTPAGGQPWWFYFQEILTWGTYPIGGLVLATAVVFFVAFRREVLTWLVLPYLAAHVLFPVKDLRFLFPLVPVVPVMVFLSLQTVYLWVGSEGLRRKVDRFAYWIAQPIWVFNLILLVVVSLLPAETVGAAYRKLLGERDAPATAARTLEHDSPPAAADRRGDSPSPQTTPR